ncbi:hypothetical protein CLAFUR4_00045, partial [Fulvia fulva]
MQAENVHTFGSSEWAQAFLYPLMSRFKSVDPKAQGPAATMSPALNEKELRAICKQLAELVTDVCDWAAPRPGNVWNLDRIEAKTKAELHDGPPDQSLRDLVVKLQALRYRYQDYEEVAKAAQALKRLRKVSDDSSVEGATASGGMPPERESTLTAGGAGEPAAATTTTSSTVRAPSRIMPPRSDSTFIAGGAGEPAVATTTTTSSTARAPSRTMPPRSDFTFNAEGTQWPAESPSIPTAGATTTTPTSTSPAPPTMAANPVPASDHNTSNSQDKQAAPSITQPSPNAANSSSAAHSPADTILAAKGDFFRGWETKQLGTNLLNKFGRSRMAKSNYTRAVLLQDLKVMARDLNWIPEWITDPETGEWNDAMTERECEDAYVTKNLWLDVRKRVGLKFKDGEDGVGRDDFAKAWMALKKLIAACKYDGPELDKGKTRKIE